MRKTVKRSLKQSTQAVKEYLTTFNVQFDWIVRT